MTIQNSKDEAIRRLDDIIISYEDRVRNLEREALKSISVKDASMCYGALKAFREAIEDIKLTKAALIRN